MSQKSCRGLELRGKNKNTKNKHSIETLTNADLLTQLGSPKVVLS